MAHGRRLVLGAVALKRVRIRNLSPAMDTAREQVEPILIKSGWFPDAPFSWVGLVFRYGSITNLTPEFQAINAEHGDLPIAVEVDSDELLEVHRDTDHLAKYLRVRTLEALVAVAERYALPKQMLRDSLANELAA